MPFNLPSHESQVEIKAILDALESSLGVNVDAASAAGSIHAKLKELRTYLSPASTVGSNADVASASGSVHAKLKDIKNSLGASVVKSVQRGTAIKSTTSPKYFDISISPVDINRSLLLVNGEIGVVNTVIKWNAVLYSSYVRIEYDRETQINEKISWQVVEFN